MSLASPARKRKKSRPLAPPKTYVWHCSDALVVVRARTVLQARLIAQHRMGGLRGLQLPHEVLTDKPEVLVMGEIAWCYS